MESEFCFQAGEMTVKDKKVHANPDRGALRFYINNETTLLTMKWENIDKKTSSEEIIITAGDWVFKKVSTKKGSPFFIQNSSYPDEKYFYYFQINKKDDIEKIEKKIIDILSKGQLPQDEEKKESKPVPMSVEELATNKDNNSKAMYLTKDAVIKDTVKVTNISADAGKIKLTAAIYDQETGEQLFDGKGNPITEIKEFLSAS